MKTHVCIYIYIYIYIYFFFFGNEFIYVKTHFLSADALIFQPLKQSHLVCAPQCDEELEYVALCATHPILNIKDKGSSLCCIVYNKHRLSHSAGMSPLHQGICNKNDLMHLVHLVVHFAKYTLCDV